MTRHDNAQRRRPPRRKARPLVLIVCGAKCTEPQYFAGLRDSIYSRAIDIMIIQQAKAPARIVQHAVTFAQHSAKDFDEIWCVVDVDEFDLESAIRAARQHSVELAVSNPCFELWLLLHHDDCRVMLDGYTAAHRRLQKHVLQYDKTASISPNSPPDGPKAVARAKELAPSGSQHDRNPSTSVWRLVERSVIVLFTCTVHAEGRVEEALSCY
jgi:RloB-like protein